ncbi:unnamed protein product, partial [Prorocentrum cordatum]
MMRVYCAEYSKLPRPFLDEPSADMAAAAAQWGVVRDEVSGVALCFNPERLSWDLLPNCLRFSLRERFHWACDKQEFDAQVIREIGGGARGMAAGAPAPWAARLLHLAIQTTALRSSTAVGFFSVVGAKMSYCHIGGVSIQAWRKSALAGSCARSFIAGGRRVRIAAESGEADYGVAQLSPRDTIICCSDGVAENAPCDAVKSVLAWADSDAQAAAERVIECAKRRTAAATDARIPTARGCHAMAARGVVAEAADVHAQGAKSLGVHECAEGMANDVFVAAWDNAKSMKKAPPLGKPKIDGGLDRGGSVDVCDLPVEPWNARGNGSMKSVVDVVINVAAAEMAAVGWTKIEDIMTEVRGPTCAINLAVALNLAVAQRVADGLPIIVKWIQFIGGEKSQFVRGSIICGNMRVLDWRKDVPTLLARCRFSSNASVVSKRDTGTERIECELVEPWSPIHNLRRELINAVLEVLRGRDHFANGPDYYPILLPDVRDECQGAMRCALETLGTNAAPCMGEAGFGKTPFMMAMAMASARRNADAENRATGRADAMAAVRAGPDVDLFRGEVGRRWAPCIFDDGGLAGPRPEMSLKSCFDPTQAEAMTYVSAAPTATQWALASTGADAAQKTTAVLTDVLMPASPNNFAPSNVGAMLKHSAMFLNAPTDVFFRLAGVEGGVERLPLTDGHLKPEAGNAPRSYLARGVMRDQEEFDWVMACEKKMVMEIMARRGVEYGVPAEAAGPAGGPAASAAAPLPPSSAVRTGGGLSSFGGSMSGERVEVPLAAPAAPTAQIKRGPSKIFSRNLRQSGPVELDLCSPFPFMKVKFESGTFPLKKVKLEPGSGDVAGKGELGEKPPKPRSASMCGLTRASTLACHREWCSLKCRVAPVAGGRSAADQVAPDVCIYDDGRASGHRQCQVHLPRSIEAPVGASVAPEDVGAKMATLDDAIEMLSHVRVVCQCRAVATWRGFPAPRRGKARAVLETGETKRKAPSRAGKTLAKKPASNQSAREVPYVRRGKRTCASSPERAASKRSAFNFIRASDREIVDMLLEDQVLDNSDGQTCSFCERGILGPPKGVQGRGPRCRCNQKACHKFSLPRGGRVVFSSGSGAAVAPLQGQSAVLFAVGDDAPLAEIHGLTGNGRKAIESMGKFDDARRKNDVLQQEKRGLTEQRAPGPGAMRLPEWAPFARENLSSGDVVLRAGGANARE